MPEMQEAWPAPFHLYSLLRRNGENEDSQLKVVFLIARPRFSSRGYTLIELSVVLAILGLLGGTALAVNARKNDAQNLRATAMQFDALDTALSYYLRQNHALPCPAPANAAENSASYGRADCTQAESVIPASGSGATAVDFGVVPTRDLGLSDRAMYDPWGNRIGYAVIRNLTGSSTYPAFRSANTATNGIITIVDGNGTQVTPASPFYVVPYILVSYGPDKKGAYARRSNPATMSTPIIPCGGTLDSENCNNDAVFRDMAINGSVTPSAYYYDLLRWHSFDASLLNDDSSVPTITPNKPLDASNRTTFFIDRTGKLWASGSNSQGDFANGATSSGSYTPVPAATTGGFVAMKWTFAQNDANSCGIVTTGHLYCWGSNGAGDVGQGVVSGTSFTAPQEVGASFQPWATMDSSAGFDCAITVGGALYCWGAASPSGVAVAAADAPQTNDWTSVETSAHWACGVRNGGHGYCWGSAGAQLGIGSTILPLSHPSVEISGSHQWQTVGGNDTAMCGLDTAGAVWCWGSNSYGQLGNATTIDAALPVSVSGTNNGWTWVNAGYRTSCGLKGGVAYCWGDNSNGRVGAGTAISYYKVPTPVAGNYADWTYLNLKDTVCGIRKGTEIWCWGNNSNGSYGNGTTAAVTSPVLTATGIRLK